MIVPDASLMLEVVLRTPVGTRALDRILSKDETLHAPHLLDLEVAQVLRRYVRAGVIDEQRALEALEDFAAFPIQRFAHDLFLNRIWDLRNSLTAYDASYVALAEALDATLLTRDRGLARGTPAHVRVELL